MPTIRCVDSCAAQRLRRADHVTIDDSQCDPPDRPAIPPKKRTPMQLYLRHLFYNVLTRNSSDKVLKLVRKLHWEDPAIVAKLHSAFTKVHKIKYSNVHLFAVLLYDLGRYHPDFSVAVIDEVLENIRVGMEVNNFKYNQQRVATIKYLGELYNYRVIDSRVVFDTLWSLVTFGHRQSPSPELGYHETIADSSSCTPPSSRRSSLPRRSLAHRPTGRLLPRAPRLHLARHVRLMFRTWSAQEEVG